MSKPESYRVKSTAELQRLVTEYAKLDDDHSLAMCDKISDELSLRSAEQYAGQS